MISVQILINGSPSHAIVNNEKKLIFYESSSWLIIKVDVLMDSDISYLFLY